MNAQAESRNDKIRDRRILFLLFLLLLLFLCASWMLLAAGWGAGLGVGSLPVALHSVLVADYGADPFALNIPAMQAGLIGSALEDQTNTTNLPGRLATLAWNLQTPVPTVTPQFGQVTTTPTQTPPNLVFPTATASRATATPIDPRLTGTVTSTPSAQPTLTPTPRPSPTRTLAPVKPTATRVISRPTNTPLRVTNTPPPPPPSTPTQA
ncbi:MAG: hypothetical protein M1281_17385, partial [Chloroflexi bacterium]|nr:hypothetical protein [Chloroflexota bacterium]